MKHQKSAITLTVLLLSGIISCGTTNTVAASPAKFNPNLLTEPKPVDVKFNYNHDIPEGDAVRAKEVWAYVLDGYENQYDTSMAITDICYFSGDVNYYGEISHFPKREKLGQVPGRVHLVITCSSYSLTHMILEKKFGLKKKLINSIVEASADFDGVQIDFETIPARDLKNFHLFLKDLRKKLPADKIFSVCVPARFNQKEDDIFNYTVIEKLCDKVFIMAYDEHWATSNAGPIAGMSWCKKICDYAVTVIPNEKIVMGLPFYGRSWVSENYGKAWLNSGVNRIITENKVTKVKREQGVPHAEFEAKVKVNLWFDDTYSLVERSRMYLENGIQNIGFWRVGQEDPTFWEWLSVEEAEAASE